MLLYLSQLKFLISSHQETIIDDIIFRLHHPLTSIILFTFTITMSTVQYIGSPISCRVQAGLSEQFIDYYCWINSTYSIDYHVGGRVGVDTAYHGIGPSYGPDGESLERIYHHYYQWIPFLLFAQGVMFIVPRFIWQTFENGRISNIIMNLNQPIKGKGESERERNLLAQYFIRTLHLNSIYFLQYIFTHCLLLFGIIFQVAMNRYNTISTLPIIISFLKPSEKVSQLLKSFSKFQDFIEIINFSQSRSNEIISNLVLNTVKETELDFIKFHFL